MEALFLQALDEARSGGAAAAAAVWLRATLDLLRASLREPWRARPRPAGPRERSAAMFGSDLRFAWRLVARQKASSLLVVTMLAFGIAANVAVFSLVNGLFLRPFPFPEPDRLVYINEKAPRWNLEETGINYRAFLEWREHARSFERMAIYQDLSFNLADDRGAVRIEGAKVTYDFAAVLGVEPIVGRMFTPDDDRPNAPPVVVISEGLWRDRFGRDPNVLTRTLKLHGVARSIVGVLPAAAEFPRPAQVWVPVAESPQGPFWSFSYSGIGRLKPGVEAAAAEQDLLRTQEPVWQASDREKVVSPFVRPLREQFSRTFKTAASALQIGVALLLIVACANVASMMLARALARRREMGIRLAIGASRLQLVRQLAVENVLLATAGGAAGLLLGRWALGAMLAAAGDQVPAWTTFGLDGRVMVFAVLATAATAILFGWAPALHATRGDLRSAVHATAARSTAGRGARRTLSVLVAAEFMMAALLLVCGGLLLRAFDRVRRVDPQFKADHVLTFKIALPNAMYKDRPQRLAFWDRLVARLQALPGVSAVGLVNCAPLDCHQGVFFEAEGMPDRASGETNPVVLLRFATPGYLKAMGITLVAGRFLEPSDAGRTDGPVVVINDVLARTRLPGVADPIGRRLKGPGLSSSQNPWFTVIGVVRDARHYGVEKPMRPGAYLSIAEQAPDTLTVAMRTAVEPSALVEAARGAVHGLDPELPLYAMRTMEENLRRSTTDRAVYSWMLAVFALCALLLALGGTYGVTSYLVSQRTREIGIRVALGARTGDIIRTVVVASLGVVAIGIGMGVAVSIGVAQGLSELLFGVSPHDATILGVASGALLAMSLAANWLPARRAARMDPMASLRAE